jgi:hypothetical protein
MSDTTSDQPRGFIDAEPARPVGQEEPVAKPLEEPLERSDRARRSGYHSRFVAVYVSLALVAGVGVGALVASIMRDDPKQAPAAAKQFTPSRVGELGAIELAEDVQRKYRLPSGQELVSVVASRNTLQVGNLGLFRVRFQTVEPYDAANDQDSKLVIPQNAIQYSLCGAGTSCALPGAASVARGFLLKREALELALRTFQNDPSVDNVSVFLGPIQAQTPWEGYTMVFDRKELGHNEPKLLSNPVAQSLPGVGVSNVLTTTTLNATEQQRIDQLTRPYLYLYRYDIIGGRDGLIHLQPVKHG